MEFITSGKKSFPKCLLAVESSLAKELAFLLLMALFFSGCASGQKGKVSGNLDNYSRNHVVAILPIETTSKNQNETAELFRRTLFANLTQAKFQLMERYVVDALLKKEGLTNPADYLKVSPIRLGEILGVDAVILSRVNKVQRLYLVLHASIEVAVSVQMVDTRSGEVLWHADQSETSFEGIAKLPLGIVAAGYGPLQFVTNKVNLFKVTKGIANSITALLKNPLQAKEEEKFDHTVIAVAAVDDFDDINNGHYEQDKDTETQFAALHKEAMPDGSEIQVAKLEPLDKEEEIKISDASRFPDLEPDQEAYKEKENLSEPEIITARAEDFGGIEETTFMESQQFPELKTDQEGDKAKERLSETESLLAMAEAIDKEKKTAAHDARRDPEVQLVSYKSAEIQPNPAAPRTDIERQPDPEPAAKIEEVTIAVREASRVKESPSFFSIQVGAFKTQTSAYKMISQLSAKGYYAFINTVQKDDGDSLYKVQLEKFTNKEAARQFANEFKAQENMDHFITQVYIGETASAVSHS